MRRATIRDVAADAGVSIGTASKALNGQGRLRPETRERVAEAARRLGFAPNPLAQALLAGRTYTVGMITADSFGRFSIPVMLGAEDALGAGRISVFMCDTRDDPEREQRYLEMLSGRRVDGLIVTGRRIEPRPPVAAGLGIPVVYAMTQPDGSDRADGPNGARGAAVLPDDVGGGAAAGAHLLETGRRHIAHITGPQRFLAARRRARGLRGVLDAAGVPLAAGDVLYGEWSERWGRRQPACCCAAPRPTRSSAAAIRSRGGWGTGCGAPGGGCRTTSRSSASTTGNRLESVPELSPVPPQPGPMPELSPVPPQPGPMPEPSPVPPQPGPVPSPPRPGPAPTPPSPIPDPSLPPVPPEPGPLPA